MNKPMEVIALSGESAVVIMDANKPVFYVVSPLAWEQMVKAQVVGVKAGAQHELTGSVLTQGAMRLNRFDALA